MFVIELVLVGSIRHQHLGLHSITLELTRCNNAACMVEAWTTSWVSSVDVLLTNMESARWRWIADAWVCRTFRESFQQGQECVGECDSP